MRNVVALRRERDEAKLATVLDAAKGAVEHEGVEVDVQIQCGAEALDGGQVAQPDRDGEDPLTDGGARKHAIDEKPSARIPQRR